MLIDIREVQKCKNNAYGNIIARGKGRKRYWVITISLKKNQMISDWATTLLHELLHAWTTALRLRGIRLSNISEHRFIYAVEEKILPLFKHLKPKKRSKTRKRI